MNPTVTALFDEATNTVTYIVADPATAKAAIRRLRAGFQPEICTDLEDPFGGPADRKPSGGRTWRWSGFWRRTSTPTIYRPPLTSRRSSEAASAWGRGQVRAVQAIFKRIFNPEPGLCHRWEPIRPPLRGAGEAFRIGKLTARALHTPGHTPADLDLSRRRRRVRRGHAVHARLRHGACRFPRRRRRRALSLHSPHSRTSRGNAPDSPVTTTRPPGAITMPGKARSASNGPGTSTCMTVYPRRNS